MIIDSHQHFWQVGRFEYPWLTRELGVLYRDYLPADLEPILKHNKVAETVLVQASNSLEETQWLLELADENEFIAGVVGWVDLKSPLVGQQLDRFLRHNKFKGVRHLVESEPLDDWLVQREVLTGLSVLEARSVPYDLLVHPRHLKFVPQIVEACPNLRMVIDHLAKPPIAKGTVDGWKTEFRELAKLPNLSCKLSGLVTEANHANWSVEDLRPFVSVALEAFGANRLIFGSDYPVCLLAASYERVIESFQALLSELSSESRDRVFATNASDFYKLG
ncbi:MAG TPA: amidohydrolase family protein [Pyrinomonadaceae bacterium]|nr:amidohydrolase family protein [Pyrinomonadaceae bacterium]